MIYFEKISINSLQKYRELYFDEIGLSQELFLEWQVDGGDGYLILNHQRKMGYFILSEEKVLIEFYLNDYDLPEKEKVFERLFREFAISKAYCKSFDSVLLTCCHTFCRSSRIIGTLFRDYKDTEEMELKENIQVRLAGLKDLPLLLSWDSDLYETPEELAYTVSNKMLYLFEKRNELIACGYLIMILPGKNYRDIGMWCNPEYRKQGYAVMVIAYLKALCLKNGYIPVCGCGIENIASRKVLERNGFLSKYCIIEFEF
jgi:predicted acetyltransferase